MSAAPPVLEMRGVRKSYPRPGGHVPVLRGADLRVAPGECVMITGPSGSGKSTLLHLAALLDSPTGGGVELLGRDVSGLPDDALCEIRKRHIGMVFQRFFLLPHRTALENVSFRFRYTRTTKNEARTLAEEALRTVGLADLRDRPARLLSAGEMQRVAVARALALRPSLLLADEPTGNLDRHAADAVMACFDAARREGIPLVIVTHNEGLLPHGTRHLVCREGRLAPP